MINNNSTYFDSDVMKKITEDMKTNMDNLDHFKVSDNEIYAGKHLLIDIWGAKNLTDIKLMEKFMTESIEKCGAQLLNLNLHHFSVNSGVSGVAILAESHISVHTWPEYQFAAFDVFMCGDAIPQKMLDCIKKYFTPEHIDIKEFKRGKIDLTDDE